MRFSSCATALAGAFLLGSTAASPMVKRHDAAQPQILPRGLSAQEMEDRKYFHEPGTSHVMSHYDRRYFHGIVSDEERTSTQHHMVQAYFGWFRDNGLDTWIAHGTLLGWWWNGRRLPWDWDMDTQVSGATLALLGDKFNQTRHKFKDEKTKMEREYLLDVGNMIHERDRGDGMNVIDARWIDVSNGLFIDITGLSETHPDTAPGVWSCKNYHKYHTSDLYPMRETIFEGVPTKVPYNYDKILIEEYKERALVVTEFQGHVWDSNQKAWTKTEAQAKKEDQERQKYEDEQRKKKEEEDRKKEEERKKQEKKE